MRPYQLPFIYEYLSVDISLFVAVPPSYILSQNGNKLSCIQYHKFRLFSSFYYKSPGQTSAFSLRSYNPLCRM